MSRLPTVFVNYTLEVEHYPASIFPAGLGQPVINGLGMGREPQDNYFSPLVFKCVLDVLPDGAAVPRNCLQVEPKEAKAIIAERGLVKVQDSRDGCVYDTPNGDFLEKYQGWYRLHK